MHDDEAVPELFRDVERLPPVGQEQGGEAVAHRSYGRGIVLSPARWQAGAHWRLHQFFQPVFVQGSALVLGMTSASSPGRPEDVRIVVEFRWRSSRLDGQTVTGS